MRDRGKPAPIADALREWARHAGVTRRLDQARAVEEWAERVGPQIAAVTRAEAVSADGILWVRVASAAWASELSMMAPGILAKLNAGRAGRIRQIRWLTGAMNRP